MFLKRLVFAGTILMLPATVMAEEVPADVVIKIQSMLADMQCEVDEANIEMAGEGYELDDVFCADGQYDIELDKDLTVVNKNKE